jgi:hypothetical protein
MRTHAFTLVLIYIWPCGTLRLYTIKLLYHHYFNMNFKVASGVIIMEELGSSYEVVFVNVLGH